MKTATVSELKKELKHRSNEELLEIALRLSKFKKENKELLTYLLFNASSEDDYISEVQNEITQQLEEINTGSFYFINKSVRKRLRIKKKYIRYALKKETEVTLLLFFCKEIRVEKCRLLWFEVFNVCFD